MPKRKKKNNNIFVNCPFDKKFISLLRPLIFTIVYAGFTPRIATERFDSGENRISKITELIKKSTYSIHDLSRIQSSKINEISRFNMPFELGIDYGLRHVRRYKKKKSLILEEKKYRYQKALSDLSNSDIKCHKGKAEELVRAVRNWFFEGMGIKKIDSPTKIWEKFNEFMTDFYMTCKVEKYSRKDINEMPTPEFISFIKKWLKQNRI